MPTRGADALTPRLRRSGSQTLGTAAIRTGHTVLFRRADLLLRELGQARADHSLEAQFRRYLVPNLLVLDDFGIYRLSQQQSEDLYALIIERHRRSELRRHPEPGGERVDGTLRQPHPGKFRPRPPGPARHTKLIIEDPGYRARLAPQA